MKFGYCIENFFQYLSPENLIETAKSLDEANFHSLWATDHVLVPKGGPIPFYDNISEPITTLAFLAGYTKKIKLGISTLILPLRNPILVAKQLASLDYLTNGRLAMSFGAGWVEGEFEFMGKDFKDRGKRFNHDLELLKALWNGESSYKGPHYSLENASFSPLNEGLKDSLFLIAGNSNHAIERAIKYANGWHPIGGITPMGEIKGADIQNLLKPYEDKLENKDFQIWTRNIMPNENFEEVTNELEEPNITGIIWDLSQGDPSTIESRKEKLIDFVRNY